MRVRAVAVAAVLALGQAAFAQQQRPPRETVIALLGGKKVSVEYGRPALQGRAIKDLLAQLPPDRVWRAGMDQATTLTTETDLLVGGKRVPAGRYTLYVHAPESGGWSLLVNSDRGVPLKTIFAAAPPELADALWPHLDGYAKIAATEVARATLKPRTPAEPMERLLISLDPARDGVSALNLTWGDQGWRVEARAAK